MLKYVLPLLALLLSCSHPSATIATTGNSVDSIYNIDYILDNGGKKDKNLNQIIDSIERREKLSNYATVPHHRIMFARGYIASRELKPYIALKYLLNIFQNQAQELNDSPQDYIQTASLISNEYYVLNRIDEAIRYSLLAIDKVRSINDMERYANMRINHCLVISDVVETTELTNQIHEAREILLSNNHIDSSLLAWSYEFESDLYVNKNEYPQAIEILNRALQIRQQMVTSQDENSHFMLAQTYITIAWCYAMLKQNNTADQYYAQWKEHAALSTHRLSMQLYSILMKYYKVRGMLTEAINLSLAYESEFNSIDSMSLATYTVKHLLSELNQMKGDYKNALKYQLEANIISDTLTQRANYAIGSEMAAIYELSEKQGQIKKQESQIRIRSSYIAFLSILFLLSAIFGLILWRNYQKRTRKNHILFRQIQELSRVNHELEEIHRQLPWTAKPLHTCTPNELDTNQSAESDDTDLYLKILNCMQQHKLFLNPKLTREDLAAEIGTNKMYISNTIRHRYDQTFTEYINNLRLEYARELLATDDQVKIETVALMSGFNSVRTFYRIFHNIYGVTPNEYRHINASQD